MDYRKILLEWKGFDVPDVFERDYSINLKVDLVNTITGPRRAGKTYFCFQIIKRLITDGVSSNNFLYVNFEDEKLIGANADDLNGLFEEFLEVCEPREDEKIYLFFDEIQNVTNWANWVRRIYDTRKDVRIVLTGSSSKLLSREIATSLRGRIYNLEIMPFSFGEFLRFNGVDFSKRLEVQKNLVKIRRFFKKYLSGGGYPFVVVNSGIPRDEILQEYYNSMIFRDVVERFNVADVKKLQILAKFVFESTSKEISYSRLSNKMRSLGFGLSRNSVGEYISYFEEAYLFFQVLKYEYSLNKQLGSIKKVYCVDNGLLNSVSFKFSRDWGKLLENLVFQELFRRGESVFYNRGEKFECDFMVQRKDRLVEVIQVCYEFNEENREREVGGLVEAMDKAGLRSGLILTMGDEERFVVGGKRVVVLPVWKWMLGV